MRLLLPSDLYRRGVEAAEDILAGALRLPVAKALDPQNPKDFLIISQRLANALKGVVKEHEASTLKAAINALDVDWTKMSPADVNKIVGAAKAAIAKPPPNLPQVLATFEASGKVTVEGTKKQVAVTYGVKIQGAYNKVDARILHHSATAQALYIRDEYGKRSEVGAKIARDVVTKGLKNGLGRDEIAQTLKTTLTAQNVNRSDAYWNMIAGVFTNRARVYGNLSGFIDGGVDYYVFDSILDKVTSLQCRFMHGKQFEVRRAMQRYEATANSEDPEDVRFTMPWLQVGRDERTGEQNLYYRQPSGGRTPVATVTSNMVGHDDAQGSFAQGKTDDQLAAAGVMVPPLHGHCRSTIRPVFDSEGMPVKAPTREVFVPQAPPRYPLVEEHGPAPPAPAPPPAPEPETFVPAPAPRWPLVPEHGPTPPKPEMQQQGFLFGEGGIGNKAPDPLTPLQLAMQKLDAIPKNSYGAIQLDVPSHPLANPNDYIGKAPFSPPTGHQIGGAKKKKPVSIPISDVIVNAPTAQANHIKWKIEEVVDGKTETPIVVKYEGKYHTLKQGDAHTIIANKMLGKDAIDAKVIDLDAPPKVKKPKAPKLDPTAFTATEKPEIKLPTVPPPATVSGDVIMGEKIGEARGSNEGGFYMGKDGVRRYVKVYYDPNRVDANGRPAPGDKSQAAGEHLANRLYAELGLGAPNSHVFEMNGKMYYASDVLEGKTFANGYTKDQAKKFMDGFIGDVLVGNWDAAGQSKDNAFIDAAGRVLRIDNGGSFLMRAKNGRKDPALLDKITEWEVFFSPENKSYAEIAATAGYSSPDDFKKDVAQQIRAVLALQKKHGGWEAFVNKTTAFSDDRDWAKVVDMLDKRTDLLRAKLEELEAPPKPAPKKGDARWRLDPLGGAPPSKGLDIDALPRKDLFEKTPRKLGHLPSGETEESYERRARSAINKADPDSRSAIKDFTGSSYGGIRRAEIAGDTTSWAGQKAKAIGKAFDVVPSEPGTVFRAIRGLAKEDVEQMIRQTGTLRLGQGNAGATSSSSWKIERSIEGFMGGNTKDEYGSYKVMFVIHGKSQIPVQTISSVEDEKELLFSKDAKFKVKGSQRWGKAERVVIIELEEID